MSDGEQTAMDKWVARFATRDELAIEYGALLRRNGPSWNGWLALNLAIMDRWSQSGLDYIKKRAWQETSHG